MLAYARTNWIILRTSIAERLAYRGDFAFATLLRFLPIVTQIFLWNAIYGSTSQRELNSYTYPEMVAYYLLVMVGRAFSSMPGLTTGIARDVRDGTVKKFLTQPVDMLGYLFWHRVAHKLVYYAVATGPFALVFWLCRDYFDGWPDPLTLAAGVATLVIAFLVGFLVEALIGLVAFWFLEVGSLVFIYMMINYFLSGHMIPLDFLQERMGDWILYLPFKFLAFVPATVLLGRYSRAELASELIQGVVWTAVLLVACRIAFARGVRRYGAFGG